MREREKQRKKGKDGTNEYLRNRKQVKVKKKPSRIKSNQTGPHRFSPRQFLVPVFAFTCFF